MMINKLRDMIELEFKQLNIKFQRVYDVYMGDDATFRFDWIIHSDKSSILPKIITHKSYCYETLRLGGIDFSLKVIFKTNHLEELIK